MKKAPWQCAIKTVTNHLYERYFVRFYHADGSHSFTCENAYTRLDSARRGARRLAKKLRIKFDFAN